MCLCILGLDDRRNERRKLKKKKTETLKAKLEVIKIKCTKNVIILGIKTNFDFVWQTCS